MWIWVIVIAVVIGGIIGLFSSRGGESAGENARNGAMAGGCMAAGCLWRIFLVGISIVIILWLFKILFG